MAYHFKNKIECYDCHEKVRDLKSHRLECSKSRKAKSNITGRVQKSGDTPNRSSFSFSSSRVDREDIASRVDRVDRVEDRASGEKKEHLDVYFLIDVSGSMEGSRLNTAKEGAREIASNMNPLDRLAIVTFDTGAFFKIKPRPVEEILRKGELDEVLSRIFAQGGTALYDAICLSVSQIHDKSQNTAIIVLTDGEDNSSTKTHQQVLGVFKEYPNITLHIVHIDGHSKPILAYNELCSATTNGKYTPVIVEETIIKITIEKIVKTFY